MNSNVYSFEKKQLSSYNYNYSQILYSYIILLIIFGEPFHDIFIFLKHSLNNLDRIIIFITIIFLFIFLYYKNIQHLNFYRIFYDFLFSILLVFITCMYLYFPLNNTLENRPSLFIILIILAIIWNIIINKKITINRYLLLILFFSITILLNIIINGITNGNSVSYCSISTNKCIISNFYSS